jgi:hypothetical protein
LFNCSLEILKTVSVLYRIKSRRLKLRCFDHPEPDQYCYW